MILATHLCFLVLAVSPASGAQNRTAASLQGTDNSTDSPQPTPTTPLPSSDAPTNDTVPTAAANRTQGTTGNKVESGVTEGVSSAPTKATTAPGSPVSIATPTASKPGPEKARHISGGHVILVLIFLVIVVLCGIVFFLRRASRTYSFDLQRPPPASRLSEPTGTFEPVNLDDLDQLADGDQVTLDDLSPSLLTNGTAPQSEEKVPNGQTDTTRGAIDATPQEEPDATSQDASSTRSTSASVGADPVEETSNSLLLDSPHKEEQNEANNPPVCASAPFIEINLEEAAQSEPSTTPPESPPSVPPFSSSPTSSLA